MDASAPLGEAKAVIIAGLVGSFLSLSFMGEGISPKQQIFSVLTGGVLAFYLAPFIAFLFHEDDFKAPIGFLVGLFGMSVCAAVFRAIKNSDLWGLIKKRFSTPSNGGD